MNRPSLGNLVARNVGAGMGVEIGGGDVWVAALDERMDPLAPHVVGGSNHCGGDHLWMRGDRLFDLERVHVLAAGHDHVLDAVGKVQVTVGVDAAGIAGSVPAVDERLAGRVGLSPIPGHHRV